jgi:cytosine/adenosine deaminase-related metal-dependent hydrolase
MPFSLRARIVYPVDRPPIDGGVVTIDGDRIVALSGDAREGSQVHDLGDVALLPAFVNAHTHLEFSHLNSPLGQPGMRLIDWLPLAIAERQKRTDLAAESIAAGVAESLASGTAAIGEISTADASAYPAESTADLAPFLEVIGFSRARAASALTALNERFVAFSHDQAPGISPHAPYTVSPSLLRMLVEYAKRRDVPVAMHLAESEEELQLIEHGTGPFAELLEARSMWDPTAIPPGMRPMHYLRMLAEAPRSLVIHGNYLDHAEYRYIAEHSDRMSLVFCPRTHAYFDHPPYPLAELLAGGVRVALGTDSRASNPDLGMLGEMRHVAQTHANVAPAAILRMTTLSAAEALGRESNLGSITPGKSASLVAVRLPASCGSIADEALAAILAADLMPSRVWLRGVEQEL